MNARERIARRVALELKNGDVANLGIGIPTLVSNYIPAGVHIMMHGEVGFTGAGPAPNPGDEDWDMVNAGGLPATLIPGGATFDSAMSFALIRGGHLNITVLGAMEVDEEANLANWWVPGKILAGMGGAMDLVVGAKRVIVAMEHTAGGNPKILKKCRLPLTAQGEVDMVVTEMAVFEYKPKMTLMELAEGVSLDDLIKVTEADFDIDPGLKVMALA